MYLQGDQPNVKSEIKILGDHLLNYHQNYIENANGIDYKLDQQA